MAEWMFFNPLKLTVFSEIGNNPMRALSRKQNMFFLVMRGLNQMRALIWNREKNIVA